ncbi:ATPase, P-type cation-transporter [Thermothelomyces thermophilus ATCC 42464]|uniref:P-type Na(+) transporter n=1 Tax=Thermothelomyces thermophilus (strain ATCC 42464 / BCRC 31852 / DSM 1799) TaxID=573729 RepID=G2Q643_THET4|nr:ATPase, P-type cation-transporter [Thermothelomyces thermophilus ATCC 42464]AEO55522.1 ATPase, P-type cation-transporter [Thermothelomyces thermophilus ATCC 42464]
MAAEFPKHPFLLSVREVEQALGTNVDNGLSSSKAAELQQKYPPNELDVGGSIAWYTIFIRQLCNAMILVLFFAMALSFGVSDYIEGGVLAAVIVLNVSIGFYQEYGAEKKMDALRALSSPSASVLRDGKTIVIPNAQVVPGDIVNLKMGDTVPADVRLFEAMNLTCDESSLTGEAIPVEKQIDNDIVVPGTEKLAVSEDEVGIGDRINMAYATTTVQKGRGRGIVVATGMQTEVGKIAASTNKKRRKAGRSMNWRKYGKTQPIKGAFRRTYDFLGKFLGLTEGTPLQIKLSKLAYLLFFCAILLAIIVFGVNKFVQPLPKEVVIYAISTGIAIIPESLVAVLTISMVVATTVMRKANVVVRDLSALEALGGVTNICSDKTGTLTQGAMIVKKVWLPPDKIYTVSGSTDPSDPYKGTVRDQPQAEEKKRDFDQERTTQAVKFDGVPDEKLNPTPAEKAKMAELTPELRLFMLSAALCNLATVRYDEGESAWKTTGEPTEIALQVFAHRYDRNKKAMEALGWRQVAEFPFDSTIKRMSVVYEAPPDNDAELDPSNSVVFTKGAVERILDLCSHVGTGSNQQPMTAEMKEQILDQMTSFASLGQRVLAVAYRPWQGRYTADRTFSPANEDDEKNLILLGLAGIYDPPRRETSPSIYECSKAGIKVHMLTGDHPETAKAIAKEVGIIPTNMSVLPAGVAETAVMKATDFDRLSDAEIDALPELPLVIARCAPETKTRMVEALRRRDAFMAMTGDGVNDAPSLSRADVGIAMGSGSDVAKSAAKIVLTDDKFNSIVAAIKEGRRMFENIQKFVLHLLSSNVGEVILLIAGLGFQDESGLSVFPISPLEILWINMVTSSFPAFGLGREKASPMVMRKPPQDKRRGVFSNQILADMMVYGLLMGICTLMTFVIVVYGRYDGQLGHDCNRKFSDSCIPVFRARAAVFAELTWLILLSAWEFKDIRRSLFRLNPNDTSRFPLFKDLYNNPFLFWAVAIGFVSVFPTVYIPYLNRDVFKHTSISWEWGVVIGMTIVYVLGIEVWKYVKRRLNILDDHKVVQGPWSQGEEVTKKYHKSLGLGHLKNWLSAGRTLSASRTESRSKAPSTAALTPVTTQQGTQQETQQGSSALPPV